jgi:hypothetical protein
MNPDNNNAHNPVAGKPELAKKAFRRKAVWIIGAALIAIALYCVVGLKIFAHEVITTTKNYGKIAHQVTYDKNNISEQEVDYLATGLTKANFFDEAVVKSVYIKKVRSAVEISISCNAAINDNPSAVESFVHLRNDVQKQFGNNKIVINLTIDTFDNVVKRLE